MTRTLILMTALLFMLCASAACNDFDKAMANNDTDIVDPYTGTEPANVETIPATLDGSNPITDQQYQAQVIPLDDTGEMFAVAKLTDRGSYDVHLNYVPDTSDTAKVTDCQIVPDGVGGYSLMTTTDLGVDREEVTLEGSVPINNVPVPITSIRVVYGNDADQQFNWTISTTLNKRTTDGHIASAT